MASVYFKNSINRHWKSRRNASGISNEEKIHLRQKLLSHLREENYKIAEMLAVLISKIARFDYPRECTCTSVILGGDKDLTEDESSFNKTTDPVYQMSLENSVRENLQTCSTLHGDAFNSAISRIHPSELAQVKQALKLP